MGSTICFLDLFGTGAFVAEHDDYGGTEVFYHLCYGMTVRRHSADSQRPRPQSLA
jgi:hypothetical protein